jgi:hypothetical protein
MEGASLNMKTCTLCYDGITETYPVLVSMVGERLSSEEPGKLDPAQCSHAGNSYSGDMCIFCAQCGVRLFLPPRLMAHLPARTIDKMYNLWSIAGKPEYFHRDWLVIEERWTTVQHPLFESTGGLPVRNDLLPMFQEFVL